MNISPPANTGEQVAAIIPNGSITDPDVSPAPEAIAITAADYSNGNWEYSGDGSTWHAIGGLSDDNALLLDPDYWVRFEPDDGFTGTVTLTFRAWDKSIGSSGSFADADPNGGATAFSSETDTMSLTVRPQTPVVQASNVTFAAVDASQMTINWANGDGAKRIVLVKKGIPVDSDPVDATSYTADTVFGSGSEIGTGNFVVYIGNGSSVAVTGMASDTAYHVAIYEFNDICGAEGYLRPGATGDQGTLAAYSVPTLSEWGMILFMAMMIAGAVWRLRRQLKKD